MRIFAISGDGIGAGKSSLAKLLTDEHLVWSLAGQIRMNLQKEMPQYPWFSKDQDTKANIKIKEYGNVSMRQVMIEHGQEKCKDDPIHWVRLLADRLQGDSGIVAGIRAIAIDDLRKVCELEHLRNRFGDQVVHFHVVNADAQQEPMYENDQLRTLATHLYSWRK